ncbi:MAG TPA: exodeoxyribonuclease V subunit beta, partial [Burkholderiales bacterium]
RCTSGEGLAHALFDALGALFEASQALERDFAARLAHWSADVARRVATQLDAHKRSRRLQSFDDLLRNLAGALAADGGAALAAALRARYAAALIDEFQDTDPLQYGIFEAIYADSTQPRYFVGDPKQAIYAFRGADVQAYLRARREAQAAFTLGVNRRSVPELVGAVNALFRHDDPFLIRDIEFLPVDACTPQAQLIVEGEVPRGALQCWFLAREAGEKAIAKGVAGQRAIEATANDIARLLRLAGEGGAGLRGKQTRSLAGRDIAVLVNTHEQARRIKAALVARGIASVTYGQDSVYHSEEAIEMARVIAAVAEPTREVLLRAALATEMLGRDAATIDAYADDGAEWEALLDRFVSYQRLAREHGFIRMWRSLLVDEGVAARVLALPNGDRRMTNLQHLADLLHQAASEAGADLETLVRLLAQARTRPVGEAEAQQLRLESDEHLVQVLTLHAAKGLEFAVVYCPFLWDGRLRGDHDEWLRFHDTQGGLAFDLGSTQREAHQQRAREEELGERLRLAYVALTRAKHRCVFVWGAINEADTSALAWLLHGDAMVPADRIAALSERFTELGDTDLRAALMARSEASGGALALCDIPLAHVEHAQDVSTATPIALSARRFGAAIPAPWRVSSFSGLIASHEREAPDYDALLHAGQHRIHEPAAADTLFALPGGAHIGTLVHQLFERIDFERAQDAQVAALVHAKLAEFDVDPRWAPVLERMLADVVTTPLDESGALRLDRISTAQRLIELEFVFPVGDPQLRELRDALDPLRAQGSRLPESIGRLVLAPARGFIRGFVDLVFEFEGRYYLADYKSNWLGNRHEDYAPAQLATAMSEAFYDLQYLLYTVALHRYLRLRIRDYDYDRHFGGVYYLFVRGMQPQHGCSSGVYATRPEKVLIERLDALLARTESCLA